MPFTFKKTKREAALPAKATIATMLFPEKHALFDPFCTYRMRRARCPDMVTPSQMDKNMNPKYVHKQSVVAGFLLIWCKHINESSGHRRRIRKGCIGKGQFLHLTTVLKPS